MKAIYNFLTLFTSLSTLLCCALPALIVGLGMGAAMAGFLSEYPELIWLSQNKFWLFLSGGLLLALGGILQYNNRNAPCPMDDKAQACTDTRGRSKWIYIISVVIYFIGFSFAYIIPRFL